jgi:hypothetical protein
LSPEIAVAGDLDYQLDLKLEMQLQDLHLKVDELVKQSDQRAQAQAEGANPDETH